MGNLNDQRTFHKATLFKICSSTMIGCCYCSTTVVLQCIYLWCPRTLGPISLNSSQCWPKEGCFFHYLLTGMEKKIWSLPHVPVNCTIPSACQPDHAYLKINYICVYIYIYMQVTLRVMPLIYFPGNLTDTSSTVTLFDTTNYQLENSNNNK